VETPFVQIEVERLTSFWARLRGLIGRPPPAQGRGVVISPCRQVHTFFMSYPIDVVHLDDEGAVLRVVTLPPRRIGPYIWSTKSVLELVGGDAARLGIVPGAKPRLIDLPAGATKIQGRER
jgi:uncharacterized protein